MATWASGNAPRNSVVVYQGSKPTGTLTCDKDALRPLFECRDYTLQEVLHVHVANKLLWAVEAGEPPCG